MKGDTRSLDYGSYDSHRFRVRGLGFHMRVTFLMSPAATHVSVVGSCLRGGPGSHQADWGFRVLT